MYSPDVKLLNEIENSRANLKSLRTPKNIHAAFKTFTRHGRGTRVRNLRSGISHRKIGLVVKKFEVLVSNRWIVGEQVLCDDRSWLQGWRLVVARRLLRSVLGRPTGNCVYLITALDREPEWADA
ncbi:hypothetical protein [Herbiconiux sp. UC225_62]|uniref:hypothetical protein n=1 Tax=Herbiconiux sp. UC225_62 TaxID=3350168 RepID=UPI0036D3AC10